MPASTTRAPARSPNPCRDPRAVAGGSTWSTGWPTAGASPTTPRASGSASPPEEALRADDAEPVEHALALPRVAAEHDEPARARALGAELVRRRGQRGRGGERIAGVHQHRDPEANAAEPEGRGRAAQERRAHHVERLQA